MASHGALSYAAELEVLSKDEVRETQSSTFVGFMLSEG